MNKEGRILIVMQNYALHN